MVLYRQPTWRIMKCSESSSHDSWYGLQTVSLLEEYHQPPRIEATNHCTESSHYRPSCESHVCKTHIKNEFNDELPCCLKTICNTHRSRSKKTAGEPLGSKKRGAPAADDLWTFHLALWCTINGIVFEHFGNLCGMSLAFLLAFCPFFWHSFGQILSGRSSWHSFWRLRSGNAHCDRWRDFKPNTWQVRILTHC